MAASCDRYAGQPVSGKPAGALIVVAGLPGAGKTTHLKHLHSLGIPVFDDFYRRDEITDPRQSPLYGGLISLLSNGGTAAAADIRFVVPWHLGNFLAAVLGAVPSTRLTFHIFGNDLRACTANIASRDRERAKTEHELAVVLSACYAVPEVLHFEIRHGTPSERS